MSNKAYFCYVSVEGVEALAAPSAVFICDYSNVGNAALQRAREKGAQVLAYRMTQDIPTGSSGINSPAELDWFMGDPSKVPVWPGRTAAGKPRTNWPGSVLADIRPGSPWVAHIEQKVGELIQSGICDGIFSDGHGAQVWSNTKTINGEVVPGADFGTWPQQEQTDWALANVNTARIMNAVRIRLNERFLFVCNNIWTLNDPKHPSYQAALEGEKYCDGVCLEHHRPTSAFHTAYAARKFGYLGQRRVLIIANNQAEAVEWSKKPGVTHVASVDRTLGQTYKRAVPVPGIADTDIRYDELVTYADRVTKERDALRAGDNVNDARVEELEKQLTESQDQLALANAKIDQALSALT